MRRFEVFSCWRWSLSVEFWSDARRRGVTVAGLARNETRNSEPRPGVLVAVAVPPIISASLRVIEKLGFAFLRTDTLAHGLRSRHYVLVSS